MLDRILPLFAPIHIGQSLRFNRQLSTESPSLFIKQVSMQISILAVIDTFTRDQIYTWNHG